MGWQDEYQKFVDNMNTPRVVFDNGVCSTATLVEINSASKHGMLLKAAQVFGDLNLSINKAHISSNTGWFMNVFNVTDNHGAKLTDPSLMAYIERSLGAVDGAPPAAELLTVLELTGTDRPGLLSEAFAVLSDHKFSITEAKVWTHNGRITALIFLDSLADDYQIQIHRVEAHLRNVLKSDSDARGATITISSTMLAGVEHRLHQMMFADRDYEHVSSSSAASSSVTVQNWMKYTIVNVQCRDRPKLLFDVICTLTDMKYVVFHGTVDTVGDRARQEFYIRHSDGTPISSEAERQRVIQCVQAAIERRESGGLRLELCAMDRPGLLAEVIRTFRENGLSITRAEVSTKNKLAVDVFYVADAAGNRADPKSIDSVIQLFGAEFVKLKRQVSMCAGQNDQPASVGAAIFNPGSRVRGISKTCVGAAIFNLGSRVRGISKTWC